MADARPVHFSKRTAFGDEADALMTAVAERRRSGMPVFDLTDSNPTRCGLGLAAAVVLPPLAIPASLEYRGEPFGPGAARAAIAAQYYAPRGAAVDPAHLFLTGSTSEAYSYLFKLLCEPGDHVLVPQPSYPLFDLLARIADVELRSYPLRFHDGWELDMAALEAAGTSRTRAIIVVHPNNPTGHYVSGRERESLREFAAERGLALIVDEVFLDYAFCPGESRAKSFLAADASGALTFVMSGLSKVLALPQMKVAWTAVCGPPELRDEALSRLEFIADTFLSVAAPGSNALPEWLAHTADLQAAVIARVRANLDAADTLLQSQDLVSRLPVDGGWSVVLRCPAWESDQDFARRLLEETGVLVHPGSFFGMPDCGFVVASLLLPEQAFVEALTLLLNEVARRAVP